MRTLFDNIWNWSRYSREKRLDFNGYVLRGENATVVVDPPALEPEDLEKLRGEPGPFHVLLTNKDHRRESEMLRNELGAQVWVHELDAELLDTPPDATYAGGDSLPGALQAVHIPDNKSPGESAFFLDQHDGVLILGDALIGHPLGELSLLPKAKYEDYEAARRGIRVLADLRFETVLVGDGASIFRHGHEALQRFLERE